MDWLVFGDDWGVHPSTTQHLILNLPSEDRVVWVNSIGMRLPTLSIGDLKRVCAKLRMMLGGPQAQNTGPARLYPGSLSTCQDIQPAVFPAHLNPMIVRFNGLSMRRKIMAQFEKLDVTHPVLLTSSPVVAQYLDYLPHDKLVYLRLDAYDKFPGCDPAFVNATETKICEQADAIVVTAKNLAPGAECSTKTHYLSQGVQLDIYDTVNLEPSGEKILGFFGMLSEWVDFELIHAVASRLPDWELQFIGKVEVLPGEVAALPNVAIHPAVPFHELPAHIEKWAAAWIPFKINELTKGVNPLKLREYLAAGLPSQCTPLPDICHLSDVVMISHDPASICDWLVRTLREDDRHQRAARRASVRGDSWAQRSSSLRRLLA